MNDISVTGDTAYDALRQLDEATEDGRDIRWKHVMAARAILAAEEDVLYPNQIDEAINELDDAPMAATDYGTEKSLQRAHSILCEIVYGR